MSCRDPVSKEILGKKTSYAQSKAFLIQPANHDFSSNKRSNAATIQCIMQREVLREDTEGNLLLTRVDKASKFSPNPLSEKGKRSAETGSTFSDWFYWEIKLSLSVLYLYCVCVYIQMSMCVLVCLRVCLLGFALVLLR